jgi:hypothetical protein
VHAQLSLDEIRTNPFIMRINCDKTNNTWDKTVRFQVETTQKLRVEKQTKPYKTWDTANNNTIVWI